MVTCWFPWINFRFLFGMAMRYFGLVLGWLFPSLFIGVHASSPPFNEGKLEAKVMPKFVPNPALKSALFHEVIRYFLLIFH